MTTDNLWTVVEKAVNEALMADPYRNQVLSAERADIAQAAAAAAVAQWESIIDDRAEDEEAEAEADA